MQKHCVTYNSPGRYYPKLVIMLLYNISLQNSLQYLKNGKVGSLPWIMISKVILMRGNQSLQRKLAGRLKLGSKCYLWLP